VSDRALDCFVHGVAHLVSELGPDGLRRGIDVLEKLTDADLTSLLSNTGLPHHVTERRGGGAIG